MANIKEKKEYPRIKELRIKKGLKQSDLAQLLNMHTTQYTRYERSETTIPLEFAHQLADFYNISIDYIAERTDIKKIND